MPSVKAFVGLGANLGRPEAQVRRAIAALGEIPKTRLVSASSLYRSAPVGVGEQPDFINAVAEIETRLSALALLDELLAIEARFGRRRESPGAPRTLDLDLLLYGDEVVDEPGLVVPHPRMHERAFVLAPLAEIAPDTVVPGKGRVAVLLNTCKDQKVEKIRSGGAPVSAETLLETLRQLAAELHPARQAPRASLDGRLEQDYGFDSLGRVELFLRLERRFALSLPQSVMASAETPRDLLRAIHAANPASRSAPLERASMLAEESATPDRAATLVEVLEWHVARHPERPHIVLQDDSGEEQTVTYAALERAARAVAAGLLDRDLQPAGAVAIMLPTGVDYFYSFFGVLLAGGVPVPIYPPARASQIEDHLRRHAGILSNALVEMLITVPHAKPIAMLLKPRVRTLKSVVTPADLARPGPLAPLHRVKPQDIAMLQYTSGSTGSPKGVVLTHANLLTNIRAMGRALRVTPEDVFVSWLPLYHDMGLIGAWMGSLIYGFKYPVMSPLTFLARPERWLWTIHRHRGTLSGGPNFLRKVEDADIEGLDLSSWRFAFNGAEPVSPDTMAAFCARFARYGLKPEAMTPCYGLAEATLGVSFTPVGRGPRLDRVERDTFTNGGRANPVSDPGASALTFVACGRPLPGHQIRVVDDSDWELAEREEGHIQFSGPSATSGYYRNPEATRELLHGEWIDTGDFGYIAEGEIYITGRVKDTIIRAGRNIYPYELEEAVGALEGIRKGCVAVFGATDARSGTERVVVLAETRVTDPAERERLRARIDELAVPLIGMPADGARGDPGHPRGLVADREARVRRDPASGAPQPAIRGGPRLRRLGSRASRRPWTGDVDGMRSPAAPRLVLAAQSPCVPSVLGARRHAAHRARPRTPSRRPRLRDRRKPRELHRRPRPDLRPPPADVLHSQARVARALRLANLSQAHRHRIRREVRRRARRRGHRTLRRSGARRPFPHRISRGHVPPCAGPAAFQDGGIRRGRPGRSAGGAAHFARHALCAARGPVAVPARSDQRDLERAARAGGRGLERRDRAEKPDPRRDPAPVRRAGSWRGNRAPGEIAGHRFRRAGVMGLRLLYARRMSRTVRRQSVVV